MIFEIASTIMRPIIKLITNFCPSPPVETLKALNIKAIDHTMIGNVNIMNMIKETESKIT